jgi:hypothetical protein
MAANDTTPSWQACPVGDFKPEPIQWLWLNRLALGRPALLEGDPELLKSFLTLDLCARLSTGRPFPDGSPSGGPANSLILNAEDRVQDTIVPRLHALEADVKRVFVLRSKDPRMPKSFYLRSELDVLEQLLGQMDARLLVVDPVVAFVDRDINWANDQSVRRLLSPLAGVAERCRCAMILIRHLNKAGGGNALYRGSGSIGVIASCRAAWLVGRDPQNPEHRVLAQTKNNLAPPQPSLVYGLEPTGSAGAVRLCWPGTSPLTADELVAAQSAKRTRRQRACDFLRAFLKDGPRTAREIWQAAQEREFGRTTLHRAMKMLGIKSVLVVKDHTRSHYWLLKGQQLPPEIDPASDPDSVAAFREAWCKKYPEPTPIDDL